MGRYFDFTPDLEKELIKFNIDYVLDETEESKRIYLDTATASRIGERLEGNCKVETIIADLVPLLNRGFFLHDHIYGEGSWNNSSGTLMISSYGTVPGQETLRDFRRYDILYFNNTEEKNLLGQWDTRANIIPDFAVHITDDKKTCIGFYTYMHIHFFFDFFHAEEMSSLHHAFLRSCIASYLKIEDRLKDMHDLWGMEEARRNFIEVMKVRASSQTSTIRRRIDTLTHDIVSYSQSIVNFSRERREKHILLKVYEENQVDFEAEFDRMFSEFRVQFDSSFNFFFITDTIVIQGITVGRFKITVNSTNGAIEVLNIDKRIRREGGSGGFYDHPHVLNTSMCLGNIAVEVAKLIGEFKYFDAAYLVREALYFYDREGRYIELEAWMTPEELEKRASGALIVNEGVEVHLDEETERDEG